jgi:hypothetical protein
MRFKDTAGRYPRFKNYLSLDFGHLAKNDKIINGLIKWGKMSRTQAVSYIISGTIPEIAIADEKDYLIDKAFENFPFTITMNKIVVDEFEMTSGKSNSSVHKTASGALIHRVGLAVIDALIQGHLRVFSDDDDDRIYSRSLLRVAAFEDEVFGGVVAASPITQS